MKDQSQELEPIKHSTVDSHSGSWLQREIDLLQVGASGFAQTAKESVSKEHLPETAISLISSIGLGLIVDRFGPAGGLVGLGIRAAGTGFGLAFLKDILSQSKQVFGAMGDALSSNCNWNKDVSTMHNLGGFCFDTALMTAGSAGSMAMGRYFEFPRYKFSEIPSMIHDQVSEPSFGGLGLGFKGSSKDKSIISAESISAMLSRREFPNDKIAANLMKKQFLYFDGLGKPLTENEQNKLIAASNKLTQKIDDRKFWLRTLMNAAENNNSNVIHVDERQASKIIMDGSSSKTSFVRDLTGCFITLIDNIKDDTRVVINTHFRPSSQWLHLDRLSDIVPKDPETKKQAMICVPHINSVIETKLPDFLNQFKKIVDNDTPIKIVYYPCYTLFERHAFVFNIPAEINKPITYRSTFSLSGKLE